MILRCNTRTAACIHADWHFRECSFQDHGIGDHTDIRAQTAQFDLLNRFSGFTQDVRKIYTTEGDFVYNSVHIRKQFIANLPAFRVFDVSVKTNGDLR